MPPNVNFIISFECHSGYTLIGKDKNIVLILMDSRCGDEGPFFNTRVELNRIEEGSQVLEETFGKYIKSTWFTDSRTTLQGRFGGIISPWTKKLKIHLDIERVETSRMCATNFKSISLNRFIALSSISRLIRQLTMMRARGYVVPRQSRAYIILLPDERKKKPM